MTFLPKNPLFKMVFDIYTPRPHFIIIENKDKQRVRKSIRDLQEFEIRSILSLIEEFTHKYGLASENLILSFHIGYWVCVFVF
jgi:hypothetical protein